MNKTKNILIVLNSPLNGVLVDKLYQDCEYMICADGGANRLYDVNKEIKPDLIIGDLDSIRQDVKEHYSKLGVPIELDQDQDTTDFEKALLTAQKQSQLIRVYGGLSGRLDHTLNNLHSMHKFNMQGCLIGECSIVRRIKCGKTIQRLTEWEQEKGVGIFPINQQGRVTTQGLKWELNQEQPLVFGQFSSACNEFTSDSLIMESLDELLLITQLKTEYQI